MNKGNNFEFKLWDDFHDQLPNYTISDLKMNFTEVKKISMNALINKIKDIRDRNQVEVESHFEMPFSFYINFWRYYFDYYFWINYLQMSQTN